MATPHAVLTAAADMLAASLPGLGACGPYAGEFSGGAIGRASIKSPAVLVACLRAVREGARSGRSASAVTVDTGETDFECRFVAYCLTRSAAGREARSASALELALAVMAEIEGARFGLDRVWPARVLSLDNLFAEAIDKTAAGLWAVTWEQTVRLGPEVFDEGETPTDIYASWAPEIGIPHEEDYEIVEGLPEDAA